VIDSRPFVPGVWTYTSFTGSVEGREVDAVVRERHDDAGRLVHAILFLRPYTSLRAAMHAMGGCSPTRHCPAGDDCSGAAARSSGRWVEHRAADHGRV